MRSSSFMTQYKSFAIISNRIHACAFIVWARIFLFVCYSSNSTNIITSHRRGLIHKEHTRTHKHTHTDTHKHAVYYAIAAGVTNARKSRKAVTQDGKETTILSKRMNKKDIFLKVVLLGCALAIQCDRTRRNDFDCDECRKLYAGFICRHKNRLGTSVCIMLFLLNDLVLSHSNHKNSK